MKMRHHLFRTAAAALVLGLTVTAGCGSGGGRRGPEAIRDRSPAASAADVAAVASALDAFAFALYRELRTGTPDGNVWFSPYSIRAVLAMALAGADGTTRDELRATLRLDLPDERLFPALNAFDLSMTSREKVTVENANWVADLQLVRLRKTYTDTIAKHFGAAFESIDPSNLGAAASRINAEVNRRTHGRIDKLIDPADLDGIVAVLLNAVYFKGEWAEGFDAAHTTARDFYRLDGTTAPVPMMQETVKQTRFATTDDWTVVDVPYKGDVSMTILMPDEGKFDEVVQHLDGATWDRAVSDLHGGEVRLTMPKWEIRPSETTDLTEPLRALGLADMFDPERADFSGISDTPLYFSWVKHQADVTVDEKGTVAAAATGGAAAVSAPIVDRITIDRPFVVAIRDQKTGAILFLGQVTTP